MLIINRSHTWQTKYVPANNYIYWLNSAYILIFLIETAKSMIIKPMAVTIAKTVTVMEQKKKIQAIVLAFRHCQKTINIEWY